MRKTAAILVALSGLAIALPVHAAESQTAHADGAETTPKKEKTVCRRETFVGSNLPKKTCRTESEWKAIDAQAQRDFSERDRNNDR